MELGARIKNAGYRIRYEPEARVTHKHRTSLRAKWRQAFWHSRGAYLYYQKHHQAPNPDVRAFARALRIPTILRAWLVVFLLLAGIGFGVLIHVIPLGIALPLSVIALTPGLFHPAKLLKRIAAGSFNQALYDLTVSTAQRIGVFYQYLTENRVLKRLAYARQ